MDGQRRGGGGDELLRRRPTSEGLTRWRKAARNAIYRDSTATPRERLAVKLLLVHSRTMICTSRILSSPSTKESDRHLVRCVGLCESACLMQYSAFS